ncbi:uncharacterized protein LOC143068900 [Mytilus galloprovincialis]|uniref:uncharacterized protein LOC143068900 n=1 Tax=Mytilus galloprovincialis TaxID=29158 RepID=UPI003F7B63BD
MGDSELTTHTSIKPDGGGSGSDGVLMKPRDNTEFEQSLQIVLGTVCGVFGLLGLILVLSFLYKFYKRRRSPQHTRGQRDSDFNSSISIDLEQKTVPTVLVLYSSDCSAHEKVVSSFAGFLIEACHCNVHLDIFEDQLIYERGLDEWLVEKLQEADFIIVMCSVGARLRCTKKRARFKCDPNRTIPDYFAIAVDYVAEKMRVERSKGLPMSRFIVAYMDYSSASDIPHQLDTGVKFNLMKDMNALFNHLHGFPSDMNKFGPVWRDTIEQNCDFSELTTELNLSLESAKEYFKANPNWIEDSMEYIPAPSKSKSRHVRKSSLEPLLKESQMNLPFETSGKMDTLVDIHNQTLPRTLKQEDLNMVPLYQRQNSLPSSLSSHQTNSSPTPPTNTSKSFENFQTNTRYQDIDFQPCMFCGLEEHEDRRAPCKGRKLVHSQIEDTEQEDIDLSSGKLKSKSMPTICPNLSSSSHTVLHADVHKEWGFQDCHLSVSSESTSDKEFALDDLEKDLQSIRMLASYDALKDFSKEQKTFPKALSVKVDFNGSNPRSELIDISPQTAVVSLQNKSYIGNMSFHNSLNTNQDDQVIQLQDIRL